MFRTQGNIGTWPAEVVDYTVWDVMPGCELSVENTPWPNTPATREDAVEGWVLVVMCKMAYDAENSECANKEELYNVVMSSRDVDGFAPAKRYPATFSEVPGLRSKYFAYNAEKETCAGTLE